ncbi:MAG: hypothetical protein AAF383_17090, partial [Cyanobacteria bacterium P01_A01_bin.83]
QLTQKTFDKALVCSLEQGILSSKVILLTSSTKIINLACACAWNKKVSPGKITFSRLLSEASSIFPTWMFGVWFL